MEIKKTLKYQHPDANFGSLGVEISLSHEEIGLPDPKTVEEARDVLTKLSLETEAMILIEQVKRGLVQPDQVRVKLDPWLPASPSSSSTAPA
jgi:hypothetical protein